MRNNEYLTFTKRERNGIIVLVIILALVMILGRIYRREPNITGAVAKIDTFAAQVDSPLPASPGDNKLIRAQSLYRQGKPPPHYAKKTYHPVQINAADTSAFIALPGIGSKLAARIVLFREKLGGFYNVSQVAEVYGLQDSVFRKLLPYLRCDTLHIRKIRINSASKDEMQSHPYIRWKLAAAIVTYRNEHGSYTSTTDLQKTEVTTIPWSVACSHIWTSDKPGSWCFRYLIIH